VIVCVWEEEKRREVWGESWFRDSRTPRKKGLLFREDLPIHKRVHFKHTLTTHA
jgi:hypothetical protein